ncbi:hypothetical protein PTTG_07336 [Puccinia triticina 1-1 BBBD Race 1]|uniref:Uncharacterized protein n=1 Tax=Puccinia triticina (isolate 1-1 / race 1 (BBBD)) TaxID=630390 RepID=A0A180GCH7_PUCT1|nr:hypothetical protein PTTG_07336 [Puccinia triticina 1-1 BBBD Race 1]
MQNKTPTTTRFMLNRGTLEPLPFANVPGETQESYLGPSQPPDSQVAACKLFYKGSPTQRNHPIHATGPPTKPPSQPRNIHIKHCIFQRTVAGQLAMANPNAAVHTKQALAEVQKHWEKVTPNGTTVLLSVVQRVTSAQFRLDVVVALGKTKTHLGMHIDLMDANGLLKCQGAVKKHPVFGAGWNTIIVSDADFDSYVDAILSKPDSEVIIRVIMADPCRTAKDRETERAQYDALAIAYGSNNNRFALERASVRVARNPHADVDAQERMRITQELYKYHRQLYGRNRKSTRIKDPANPARSFRVTAGGYKTWAMAIMHSARGVDQDHPPRTDQFVLEKEVVYSLAKLAAQASNRLSKHKSAATAPEDPPSGLLTLAQSTLAVDKPGPRPPVFASVSQQASSVGAGSPLPRLAADSADPSRATLPPPIGASTPSTPVYTPVQRSVSGQFLPPPVVPTAAGAQPSPPARFDIPLPSPTKVSADLLFPKSVAAQAAADKLNLSDQDKLPFSPDPSVHVCSTCQNSLASTDIEILPRPKSDVDRKGPHGDGIAHTISCINFGWARSPIRAQPVSPTLKTPASCSCSDSMASWFTESVPTADYPLNEAGKALTMEAFLDLLCFDKGDVNTRGLLAMSHICRWDFFLQTSPRVLETKFGFPYAVACQLIKGAMWLIPTHVIVPNPKGHTSPPRQPISHNNYPAAHPSNISHKPPITAIAPPPQDSASASGPPAHPEDHPTGHGTNETTTDGTHRSQ